MELIEKTIREIEPQDKMWRDKAMGGLEQLTMPQRALGRRMGLTDEEVKAVLNWGKKP